MSEEKCSGNCVGCSGNCGNKKGVGKTHRPELLPHKALMEVIKVFTDGTKKYSDFGWKEGISYSRLYGAVQRHLLAFWCGKTIDKDSGSPALAHAIAGLMMLLEMDTEWDDRDYQKEDLLDFTGGAPNIIYPLFPVQNECQAEKRSATNSPANAIYGNQVWDVEEMEVNDV